ncbi:MAG: allophanate hydrolase, partial [Gemmatimonadetes bacterium]|nr:allophanate hydrolase [Gemmatimonadota bacterium]
TIALTGADCEATVEREPVGAWRTVRIEMGQTLRLGFASSGMRAYVAFPGGLDAPAFFGSTSVVARDGLPAPLDRGLERDDRIGWRGPGLDEAPRVVPSAFVPDYPDALTLPLLLGYEWDRFAEIDRDRVLSDAWTVDGSSDRIASRLAGPRLESGPTTLDSVPLVDGTVQVPGDGVPLVFMRDRPTIGGYPKLGSLGSLAVDRLAQARPGTAIRFRLGDAADLRAEIRRRQRFFGSELV